MKTELQLPKTGLNNHFLKFYIKVLIDSIYSQNILFFKRFLISALFIGNFYSYSQVTIARQDFETSPATPTLTFSPTLGQLGSVTPGSPASATTVFAGARGYYFTGNVVGPAVFTSNADVDTRCYSNPSLTFRLAALATNGAQGLDVLDIVTVAISTNGGTTFTNEMQVKGFSNAVWSYTAGTGNATAAYDGNVTVESGKIFAPTAGGVRTTDGYSTVILTGLPKTANLRVKITLANDAGNETWAIDNVVINNAVVATTPTTPTFTAVSAICSGGSLSALPTTSNNGITGTWSPTLNNLTTTTYTFTPTAGLCATTTTLSITVIPNVTYYQDLDSDGFGNNAVPNSTCLGLPIGYVLNNLDSNDNLLTYVDVDNDGFGSAVFAPSGPTNNIDCNDNQLRYADLDSDSFGSTTFVACGGVLNNSDCNDNQLRYADLDSDSFGSTTFVACGGVLNNLDCNDNQLQYLDADADGFGSTTQVACGVTNNSDCNDNQIQYVDLDNDGFGSTTQVACGVTNNSDCNDNQLRYADLDSDSFGSTTFVACGGVLNNLDSNDNLLTYVDVDNDGFGSTVFAPSGPTNNSDCNDNQIQYLDADADSFGSTTQVACGVLNNSDCNDNNITMHTTFPFYLDADLDGYGSTSAIVTSLCAVNANTPPLGYSKFNTDCDDTNATIHPGAVDVCGDGIDNDCNGNIDNVGMPGGCIPVVTTIRPESCGVTLPSIDTPFLAYLVSNAQGYRWRVTKVIAGLPSANPADVQMLDTFLRSMKLTQLTTYSFGTTYQIE
ncbi:putative metal-binding motif-containing protein, partial [Flavobacterium sp.]|uniref:putative metal-binding motif-containing protein n=1 Tax=Flavobacterium sp. TaxID=239 RepID=UPI003753694C